MLCLGITHDPSDVRRTVSFNQHVPQCHQHACRSQQPHHDCLLWRASALAQFRTVRAQFRILRSCAAVLLPRSMEVCREAVMATPCHTCVTQSGRAGRIHWPRLFVPDMGFGWLSLLVIAVAAPHFASSRTDPDWKDADEVDVISQIVASYRDVLERISARSHAISAAMETLDAAVERVAGKEAIKQLEFHHKCLRQCTLAVGRVQKAVDDAKNGADLRSFNCVMDSVARQALQTMVDADYKRHQYAARVDDAMATIATSGRTEELMSYEGNLAALVDSFYDFQGDDPEDLPKRDPAKKYPGEIIIDDVAVRRALDRWREANTSETIECPVVYDEWSLVLNVVQLMEHEVNGGRRIVGGESFFGIDADDKDDDYDQELHYAVDVSTHQRRVTRNRTSSLAS